MSIGGADQYCSNRVSGSRKLLLLCLVNLLEFPQSKAINDWLVSFFSLIYDSAPEYYACAKTHSHYLVEDVDEYASPYQMAINAASMASLHNGRA